jgi:hypothetical protein
LFCGVFLRFKLLKETRNPADITYDGKMMADVENVRVWKVMIVDCVNVQSNIRLELMSKTMFNTTIGPVRILVLFHPNANPSVDIEHKVPVNVFLIRFWMGQKRSCGGSISY